VYKQSSHERWQKGKKKREKVLKSLGGETVRFLNNPSLSERLLSENHSK
jgi:hypothetical protein